MKKKKLSNINIFIVISIFISVVFFMYKLSVKEPENNYDVEFRGGILKITKYYRGRYDLELSINGTNKIILSDYDFGLYKEKIKLGDSLIKSKNTDCFYYKRKEIIIEENCNNIRELHTVLLSK